MKRFTWMVLLLAVTSMAFALNSTIAVSQEQTKAQLTSNSQSGLSVRYTVGDVSYQNVATPSGAFTEINIDGYANTNKTGLPQLPLLRQIIRVPVGAVVVPHLSNEISTIITLSDKGITNRLMPRQESVSKSADPSAIRFLMDNDFYNGTFWTNEPTVKVEEIGMMRGERLVALDFTPVQYNPSTGQIKVITSVFVDVTYPGADWAQTDELSKRYYSPAFEPMMAQSVLNYVSERTTLNRYPLGMIIVAPQNYVATLQPFINWKKKQGYTVTVATATETGSLTTTAIKTYLQNIWNNATAQNPAPSYLLICGDTGQVPAWNGNTAGGHVTDLTYVRLQGTDFVPEMYFGRFSAQNTTQLQTYVDKTLQYEMYTMPDPSYLARSVLIAGADPTYGPTHGNGQINYGKTNYFGESSTVGYGPYGILNTMYPYPGSANAEAQVIANMNAGLGFINYTAHGSETSWADPTVTVGNVNNLTNVNKYFVAIGNCCLTSAFDTGECFGEAITRSANKGAVAYIGGTNSSYWDEDYYWAVGHKPPIVGSGSPYIANRIGAYDAIFHSHNEDFADWAGTMGAMNFMGNLAVTASNSSRIDYYWEIYSIMGDPSLIPYMGIPTPLTSEYSPVIQIGLNSMQIMTDPFTQVALSQDNVLHGVGVSDATGALNLNFTPFTTPGTAQLVMTRSLRKPTIADLTVTASAGPYVMVNNMTVNDGNNAIAESGETMYLDVTINNVGTVVANNVTATMTTTSPYVNILNGTANLANVQINTPMTIEDTFRVLISPTIPDQEAVEFSFLFHDSANNNWTATRNLTVNAPNIVFGSPTFFDPNGNGAFEPGETIDIDLNISNTGHMIASDGYLDAVINSPFATMEQNHLTLPGFNIGASIPVSFSVTLSQEVPLGSMIPIGLALTAGTQLFNSMIALPVGATIEGFETGNLSLFPWINESPIPWTVQTGAANAHTGTRSAKSGAIGANGTTELSISLNVVATGNLSFWRKVSTEAAYDFLKFYIDNVETASWAGTQNWAQFTYSIPVGTHTFKWAYIKDYGGTGGSDCVWLDDIAFPLTGDANVPLFFSPVTALEFGSVPVNTTVTKDFVIRNLGQAPLTGTINVPQVITLLEGGVAVTDTYNFTIPGRSSKVYTAQILVTAGLTIDDNIVITDNDVNYPNQQIAVHLQNVATTDPFVTPVVTKLDGNYPNPFNPTTSIRFSTKEAGKVTLMIYNSKGQVVRTLVNEDKKSGNHAAIWNGTDDNGKPVSSGLYLYKMQTGKYTQTKKMMLMK